MLSEEDKDQSSPPAPNWKSFSRSISWTERPPRTNTTTSKPQWNSKARACLPPLQPLSIIRPTIEEWPRAGSDDLGIWPNNPPTPGARTPRENSTSTSDNKPPLQFDFKKDKLAFFDKDCSRILDHIYLGSDSVAKDLKILRKNKITHVLNCVGYICQEYFKNEFVYKTLWLQDSPSEDITSILYDVFDYFEDVREQGKRVLVHCRQGVSRSTSLVIAYLMWKEGRSFDEAFHYVKAARGVTNPNVGFACQLLQCQKRVHALPPSPSSVLRMYRMGPHSPYDPLHLVPKTLTEVGGRTLDSRGAFVVHVPNAIYVWVGRKCSRVMEESATSAACQVIRYERATGPVVKVREGEEELEFWEAIGGGKTVISEERRVKEYDLDFEIFNRALAGGVVPPLAVAETEAETRIPAKGSGWNIVRKKLGVMKELMTGSQLNPMEDIEECNSPDSFASYVTGSPENSLLARSPSLNSIDSFSSFLVGKAKSSSTSPSVSPSNSDYSGSFTFSPSSSNWSDLSFVSAQLSPTEHGKSGPVEKSLCTVDESTYLLDDVNTTQPEEEKIARFS